MARQHAKKNNTKTTGEFEEKPELSSIEMLEDRKEKVDLLRNT